MGPDVETRPSPPKRASRRGTEVHVRCSSPRRTARGQYDASAIRHSVGGKVAGDTRLWNCCNPDTSGGNRRRLSRDCRIEPFASCSLLPIRGPSVAPPIHPTDEPARKPRPCWGFRLVISSSNGFQHAIGAGTEAGMTLRDDLRAYILANGRSTITLGTAEVVIVGETHGFLSAPIRTTAMRRLVRELLSDPRFRYFGNASFLNAGPVRQAIRDYWLRAVLPPEFDPAAPGADAMDDQERGRRLIPRRFQPVLD